MPERVNSQLIKTINERRILNVIREAGPISRNELANITKISKVAVSSIISRLDDDGYILEIGKGQSTSKGGKRPTLLKLNPDNGYVIGIQIKRGTATIALANIESEIKGIEHINHNIDDPIDHVLSNIFHKIDSLLRVNHIPQEKLISIGIGIPGFIDYEKGVLKFAVTLREWINHPLSSRFSEYYNVPTIIENDVNVITLSESLLGAGQGHPNLVCIYLESGIGAGILLNGQIVRGQDSHAGEIGYLEIGNHINHINRLGNLYNNQRYFGELLSEINLFDTLKMKLQTDPKFHNEDLEKVTLVDVLHLSDNGNLLIQEVLNEYAYPLAVISMNLIKSLNPGLLILSGRIIENSNYLFRKVKQLIKQSMINIPLETSTIVVGELKDRAGVVGAIVMALKTIFELPVTKTNAL